MKRIVEHGPLVADGLLGLEFDRAGDGGRISLGASDDGESKALRKELIERVTKGEHIELLLNACTFAQGPGVVMRKPILIAEEALAVFAQRAPGTPFQHSHSLHDRDCGGYCETSAVEPQGKVLRLCEGILLNTPRSVQSALRGNMRKFSISWYPMSRESVLCSLCKKPMLRCDHYPGQKVDGGLIKLLYTDIWPIERSHVMFPAVDNTGPESWTALSALRDEYRRTLPKEIAMEWNDLIARLGLGATAGPQDVANEIARLTAEVGELKTGLAAVETLRTEKAELEATKQELETQVKELEAKATATECDQLIEALAGEGRLIPGSSREQLIRDCYKDGNVAFAEKLTAQYREESPLVPVATSTARQSSAGQEINPDRTANPELAAAAKDDRGEIDFAKLFASLDEHIREMAGPLAKDPERYIRSSPMLCAELGIEPVTTE